MLGVLPAFQIMLTAGVPFGKFAWGVEHITLPLSLLIVFQSVQHVG